MNPINLFGNPQQFLKQMMGNNQVMNNPMAKNALDMAQKGDMKRMPGDIMTNTVISPADSLRKVTE